MSTIHEINLAGHFGLSLRLGSASPGPRTLWARGNLDLLWGLTNGVAIVGARAATAYGMEQAWGFASHLAAHSRTVISGAALGIDQAAHRAALAVGGKTIAVLAGGVDVPYPRQHEELIDRIAQDGLVVSTYPPGTAPNRQQFLARNGVIAALCTDMIVVEASQQSGSLSAARQAYEQGRRVWAVPGPVTSTMSEGCHHLIRTGVARIITNPEELA